MEMDLGIKYDDIIAVYQNVLDYCGKHSDAFSFLTPIRRPYSEESPHYEYADLVNPFELYLIKQTLGVKRWRVAETAWRTPHALNLYRPCKDTRKLLAELPNVFLAPGNHAPEDICFYRQGRVWFCTVTHEKMAFIKGSTEEDRLFLETQNIRFWYKEQ